MPDSLDQAFSQHWDNNEDPMVPSERSLYSLFCRIAIWKKIGIGLIARRLGESTQLGLAQGLPTSSTLVVRIRRRHKHGRRRATQAIMCFNCRTRINLEESTPLNRSGVFRDARKVNQ